MKLFSKSFFYVFITKQLTPIFLSTSGLCIRVCEFFVAKNDLCILLEHRETVLLQKCLHFKNHLHFPYVNVKHTFFYKTNQLSTKIIFFIFNP